MSITESRFGTPPPRVDTPPAGLTDAEVRERVAQGLTNDAGDHTSRTYGEIIRANVLTRFNAILGAMLVIVLAVGSFQDALFGIILVVNSAIGIIQEVRAKRTLDRLAVLAAPLARVVRDGTARDCAIEEVVLDDIVDLRTGDQVAADGIVTDAVGLEIDESLLTGEADSVDKAPGDEVLSGSFVVVGSGRFQATRVGSEAYARKLATEARRFSLTKSELVDGINTLLRYIQYALYPVAVVLLVRQISKNDVRDALISLVSAVVGMIPEGLVLLTSLAFGIAAVTLARRKVLVQELPAVEGLARVDVVCLDKTGTLTEGEVVFDRLELLDGASEVAVGAALAALADDPNANATLQAIGAAFTPGDGWRRTGAVPFSSARKWSAATFDGQGSWVIGAPEMVCTDAATDARRRADTLAAEGRRVLLLAHAAAPLDDETLPPGTEPRALVLLEEKIRPDAPETLRYFADQGVALKVISGDNPRTVGAVAGRVGLPGADDAVDARELPDDPAALADILETRAVFGRVTPEQKRAMVGALQSKGHVVAMTGDGVNDALALKDADIGVAMGSGAAATRAVAQLVLLDGKFATLPGVVAEGRRVIANIERSANLFVTKTVYAILIAVFVAISGWKYPYLPRQLTIVSTFTIGIPGFFLALAPNKRRYVPGFLERVLRFTVPAGAVAAVAALSTFGLAYYAEDLVLREARTCATLALCAVGLWVLVCLARPFNWWRTLLVAAMVGSIGVILAVPWLRDFYALKVPSGTILVELVLICLLSVAAIEGVWQFTKRSIDRRNPEYAAAAAHID